MTAPTFDTAHAAHILSLSLPFAAPLLRGKALGLLEWVRDIVTFACPDPVLLLAHHMFHPHLSRVFGFEFADESRIP